MAERLMCGQCGAVGTDLSNHKCPPSDAEKLAAVEALPGEFDEMADVLSNPASVVAYAACAAKLREALGMEGEG